MGKKFSLDNFMTESQSEKKLIIESFTTNDLNRKLIDNNNIEKEENKLKKLFSVNKIVVTAKNNFTKIIVGHEKKSNFVSVKNSYQKSNDQEIDLEDEYEEINSCKRKFKKKK